MLQSLIAILPVQLDDLQWDFSVLHSVMTACIQTLQRHMENVDLRPSLLSSQAESSGSSRIDSVRKLDLARNLRAHFC